MRKFIVSIALMCAIVSTPLLAGCSSGSGEKDYSGFFKTFTVNLESYTIEAVCQEDQANSMTITSAVVGDSAMQITTTGRKGNDYMTTNAIISDDFSMVQMNSSDGEYESFYCKGNLMDENIKEGLVTGRKLYQVVQNAIDNSVYSEYQTATTVGDVVRVIYKTDTESELREAHFSVYLNGEGNPIMVEIPCTINEHNYILKLDMLNMSPIQMDRNSSQYVERSDLQSYYVKLINYTNDYVFKKAEPAAQEPVQEKVEPTPTPEPTVVPAEPTITDTTLLTLPAAKDLFVQLTFSNFVDDVEFISPTGGTYKPESGNVEMMKDSDSSLTAYYRIPNAEMGVWTLRANSDNNTIDWQVITDNKIKINGVTLSDIKDGIISVTADLLKDKNLEINYEYRISVENEDGNICATTNGIVNSKDPAKYNMSVMDLEPGTYKARLRIEYMYDGQKFFNMYTTGNFTKE